MSFKYYLCINTEDKYTYTILSHLFYDVKKFQYGQSTLKMHMCPMIETKNLDHNRGRQKTNNRARYPTPLLQSIAHPANTGGGRTHNLQVVHYLDARPAKDILTIINKFLISLSCYSLICCTFFKWRHASTWTKITTRNTAQKQELFLHIRVFFSITKFY